MDIATDILDLDMELSEISLIPDLRKCAILLDIDGTILDLAPSPQQVWVPPGLAPHAGAAGWPDRRRGGAGFGPPAQRYRSDLFAARARRDRRPWRGDAHRRGSRADCTGRAAQRRAQTQAGAADGTRARHTRRRQRLFACAALSPRARERRTSCAPPSRRSAQAQSPVRSKSCPASSLSRSRPPA